MHHLARVANESLALDVGAGVLDGRVDLSLWEAGGEPGGYDLPDDVAERRGEQRPVGAGEEIDRRAQERVVAPTLLDPGEQSSFFDHDLL